MSTNNQWGVDDRVAIVGIGARLPGARDHHEYIRQLRAGYCAVREISPERWDPARYYSPDITLPNRTVSKWCAMIDDPYAFDHAFFRVSPREAELMDPQQRQLLEQSWRCVEDAGIEMDALRRARTSVVVGVMARDHLQQVSDPAAAVEGHSAVGAYDSLLANRLSHALGLRGASLSIDAACASSLVAVDLGIRSLLTEEADYVLAGGVSLNLHPWKYISFSKARMLSPRGLCRTFDRTADGYVPGDGVAMVLLRRLSDALRDGDHIYGLLAGTAVNHGGQRPTITAPTVASQREVIERAMTGAGFDPRTVSYVEAHGTGTSLGDPIEVEALRQVFGPDTDRAPWCTIGSVKPNIGHLEAAAGVAGLIKVLMMIRTRCIPPSINLDTLNPLIDLGSGPFRITTSEAQLAPVEPSAPLRCGVSSFGMGGANAHVCVEEHRPAATSRPPATPSSSPTPTRYPFLLSARTPAALSRLIDRWREQPEIAEEADPADVCALLARGREHFPVRVGALIGGTDDLQRTLTDLAVPTRSSRPAGWWLRAGELDLPDPEQLPELLSAGPLAEAARTAVRDHPRLAPVLEGLTAGRRGSGETCLFGYLVLTLLLRAGVQPQTATASGAGVWPALAAIGAVDPADAVHAAAGAAEAPTITPPRIPFAGPAPDERILPRTLDEAYLRGLFDAAEVPPGEAATVLARAAELMGQRTYRANVMVWNRAFDDRGLAALRIPQDGAELSSPAEAGESAAAEQSGEPTDVLLRVLAAHHALDQLNRKWALPRMPLVSDPAVRELLDLLLDGVCEPDDVLALARGDHDEWQAAAHRVAQRVDRLTDHAARYPLLAAHSAKLAADPQVAAWVDRLRQDGDDLAVPGPDIAVVDVLSRPPADAVVTRVTVTGGESLLDYAAGPLLALWSAGIDVDWHVYWGDRPVRRMSLPTYEFDRVQHRRRAPTGTRRATAGPAVAAGSALIRAVPRWSSPVGSDRATKPAQTALVVVSPDCGATVIEAAGQGLGAPPLIVTVGAPQTVEGSAVRCLRPDSPDDWRRLVADLADQGQLPAQIVVLGTPADQSDPATPPDGAVPADLTTSYLLVQALAQHSTAVSAHVVVAWPGTGDGSGPEAQALAGLAVCLPHETSRISLTCLCTQETADDPALWAAIRDEFARPDRPALVRYADGQRSVREFHPIGEPPQDPESGPTDRAGIRPQGVYLVTGGAGGLGRTLAVHILATAGTRVALVGRSAQPDTVPAAVAESAGVETHRLSYHRADVTDAQRMAQVVAEVHQAHGLITGVVHAAGVLRDRLLVNASLADLAGVLAPKLTGIRVLDHATRDEPLDFFGVFSSVVADIGNSGQSGYAIANGYLGGFAEQRARWQATGHRNGDIVTLDWPLWAEGGMTVPEHSTSVFRPATGLAPMPTEEGLRAFDAALAAPGRYAYLYGDPASATRLLTGAGAGSGAAETSGAGRGDAVPPAVPDGRQPATADGALATATAYLQGVFGEFLNVPADDLDPRTGFDQYGLDSIFIGQVNGQLERDWGPIPQTLLFECRNLGQVAQRLVGLFPDHRPVASDDGPSASEETPASTVDEARPSTVVRPAHRTGTGNGVEPAVDDPALAVAVIGLAGRYPQAPDLATFWRNLSEGRDCVSDIPPGRWEEQPRSAEEDPIYCRWGGFLDDVDRFDPLFFSISPRDAEVMDPQERLFLEVAWQAFEDAGYPPHRLGDPDRAGDRSVGVFVGVTTSTYLLFGPDQRRAGNPGIPTSTPWSIANRVSYSLDLRGPSMPVDTACASSLYAIHLACDSLARGECAMALIGGVNLYLHPIKYEWLCQMQMLSPTGRCHTFGSAADGFVPGEGVGAALLKPLAAAVADGDKILGVIRGSAVNHGGRTSGFTVPSPTAQAELAQAALSRAGIDARTVGYVEAHGTGTPLGDPIEITGLMRSYGVGDDAAAPCALGSVKTNIGHLESAAGIAGLTKVLLQMRHRRLVPSLHAEQLNPRIELAGSRLQVQRTLADWVPPVAAGAVEEPLRAGIGSFGAGGANAHVVVEEFPQPAADWADDDGEQVVTVSAFDADRLREHCANLAAALRDDVGDATLAEVAYQLQVRREPLRERYAFLVNSIVELADQLAEVAAGQHPDQRCWRTDRSKRKQTAAGGPSGSAAVEQALAEGDLARLGQLWVDGATVPWERLHRQPRRHVELPAYPFARERYWLPSAELTVAAPGGPAAPDGSAGTANRPPVVGDRHPMHVGTDETGADVHFTGAEFFLDDHRVDGVPIFPAVGYLELVRAAVDAGAGNPDRQRAFRMRGNVWSAALTVPQPVNVRLDVRSVGTGTLDYLVRGAGADGEQVIHAQGKVDLGGRPDQDTEHVDVDQVRSRCTGELSAADFYARIHSLGLQLGPSYQGIERIHLGDDEAVAQINLPDHLRAEAGRYLLHPVLFDSALQSSLWLVNQQEPAGRLHLPFTIGEVEIVGKIPDRCYSHVVLRTRRANAKKLDITLLDEQGRVVLRVRDFWLRPWQGEGAGKPTESYFRPEWRAAAALPAAGDPTGPLLALVPTAAAGAVLAAATPSARVVTVIPADSFQAGTDLIRVRPRVPSDIDTLLSGLDFAPATVLFAWPTTVSDGRPEAVSEQLGDGLVPLFALVRGLLTAGRGPVRVLCVTPRPAGAGPAEQPAYAALTGFLRTAQRESPRLSYRIVELPADEVADFAAGRPGPTASRLWPELLDSATADRRVGYHDDRRSTWRWQRATVANVVSPLRPGGVYLITGGAGSLGLLIARHLARRVGARLMLVGRSPADERVNAALDAVRADGGQASYVAADVGEPGGARSAVAAAGQEYGTVDGVVHCAGVLHDDYLLRQDIDRMRQVLAPKVFGAVHLDQATRDLPLAFFVLFSSVAGALGTVAQAGYAYANAFLDSFAEWREELRCRGERNGSTMSMAWPLWRDGGMQVDEEVERGLWKSFGLRPLSTDAGLAAFDAMLSGQAGTTVFVAGDGERVAAELDDAGQPAGPAAPTQPVEPASAAVQNSDGNEGSMPSPTGNGDERSSRGENGGVAASARSGPDPEKVQVAVAEEVAATVKLDPSRVDPSADIGSYGFDSLAFNRLSNQLNDRLGVNLTPATFFEYTTVEEVTEHLVESFPEEVAAATGSAAANSTAPAAVGSAGSAAVGTGAQQPVAAGNPTPVREPIAIIGMHGTLPGSADLAEYWRHLEAGRDLVTEIPPERWNWRDYFGDPQREPNRTNSKWGGFLPEVDTFDARFFGISPREAELMDPQQRLFLQTTYRAIEEAGYQPAELSAVRTGLYVGVATHDYYDLLRDAGVPIEAYTTTGLFHAILANRVSYLLNLTGPSFPIDTACSSSLVALRSAVESLWAGSCDVAIVGGVNLLLSPMIYISFARAGMLSPTGRCRTFDAGADGYVRGEGVGALLLKPLSRAVADGDHIHAVIRGSAVNHGGRVNTMTTPNPNAQAALIVSAFEEADVDPATVGYIEMHGTGTALGDPIEINGLKKAFKQMRKRAGLPALTEPTTIVGSVKSNIGHLEAAAGMAGIFKAILAMKHGRVPGNLHINELNPNIQLDGSPLRIATTTQQWPQPSDDQGRVLPRRAGVSAFGFGGVNGQVLLEQYLAVDEPVPVDTDQQPRVFVVSARTADQLREYAGSLAEAVRSTVDKAGSGQVSAVGSGRSTDVGRSSAGDDGQGRLRHLIADLLDVHPDDVPVDEPFEDLGLDAERLAQLRDHILDMSSADGPIDVHPRQSVAALAATLIPITAMYGDQPAASPANATATATVDPAREAIELRNIAYTLQVGRAAMRHRLAVVADSAVELAERLAEYAGTGLDSETVLTGVADGAADRPDPEADPLTLARAWVTGATVDWTRLYGQPRPRRASLPTYPFARTRHWIPQTGAGHRVTLVPAAQTTDTVPAGAAARRLLADEPIVGQHRVAGRAVFPGVGHLELARLAAGDGHVGPYQLDRVVWARPLDVPDGHRDVRVTTEPGSDGTAYRVRDAGGTSYSMGTWRPTQGDPAPSVVDIAAVRQRCARRLDAEQIYQRFTALGIEYGPMFRGIREAWTGDREGLARIAITDAEPPTPAALHPTIMDAGLQLVTVLDFTDDEPSEQPGGIPLPFAADSVQYVRPLPASGYAYVRSAGADNFDVWLLDDAGQPCVLLREVTVRRTTDAAPGPYFRPAWVAAPITTAPATAPVPAPRANGCLIVHAGRAYGLGPDIAGRAGASEVYEVTLADSTGRIDDRTWRVDPGDPAAWTECLSRLGPIGQVWFLAGLADTAGQADVPGQADVAGRVDPVLTLLRLWRVLSSTDSAHQVTRLRVLINDVHDTDGCRIGNPTAGGLVGFSKALAKEQPQVEVVCVDIGVPYGADLSPAEREWTVNAVLAESGQRDNHDVAYRQGQRYIRTLSPVDLPTPVDSPFRQQGVYLIVGGGTGIGRELARHLARTVAARLVLVGRRPQDGSIAALIDELAALGGQASYASADVADPQGMRGVIEQARGRYGDLHGVVHAGMVLRDGIIDRLADQTLEEVLRPKIAGSRALVEVLAHEPLDFLLFMSSVQSFTGSAGQSNYAAASTGQDAVARWAAGRCAFPVRVVNWGYWGTVGSVATDAYRQSMTQRGYGSISPAEGMATVERLLASDEHQVIAINADERVLTEIGVRPAPGAHVDLPTAVPLDWTDQDDAEQRDFDELICRTVLGVLQQMGLFHPSGAGHRWAELSERSGCVPAHVPLLHGLVHMLLAHGYLSERAGVVAVRDGAAAQAPDGLARAQADLAGRYPNLAARLDLTVACLPRLREVLSGESSGPEVMFPGGSFTPVARIYRGERLTDYCNAVVADQVRAHLSGRRYARVLEVGAGTGGTTRAVLGKLADVDTLIEYDYTDVSARLLRDAERAFSGTSARLRYRELDIERDVRAQGFETGSYDVLIAANVLHATRDLDVALVQARELLADGGLLVLTELTRTTPFHTVTFGLLDGWWHYRDGHRRLVGSPLLDEHMWRLRLEQVGFAGVAFLGAGTGGRRLTQRVVRAAAPAVANQDNDSGQSGISESDLRQRVTEVITSLVAQSLNMGADEVDPRAALSSIGVDSIVGVELINQINGELGTNLKTIVVFDHPTVEALTTYLVEQHGGALAAQLAPPAPSALSQPEPSPEPAAAGVTPAVAEPATTGAGGSPQPPGRPVEDFLAVRFDRPGHPNDLRIVPIQPTEPGPGEVEILVRAFPVNFSDFLAAKGLYPMMPDFPFTPGVEVSGVVRRVGPGVHRLSPGDEVIALTRPEMGGQAAVVITDENFAVPKPGNISHEEACGLPVAFLAMYLAFERAAARSGERVLIPAATGANGLMAVQLAQDLGARIVATAGSPRKLDYLRQMGVTDVINHRQSDVRTEVLRLTDGRGVDVVINTQGDGSLQTGLDLLAPDGRYVEIAVFGLQSARAVDLSHLVDNQSFLSFNTKKFFLNHPQRRVEYLEKMTEYFRAGRVRPHVARVFPFAEVTAAYAAKEDRESIGRIVVSMPTVAQPAAGEPEPTSAAAARTAPIAGDPGGRIGRDIAVVGVSARFPGADDTDQLWRNLAAGRDAVREVPPERWAPSRYFDPDPTRLDTTYCKHGGFLDHVDRFDPAFFNISGKEAAQTDPQQRLFLQESWRALQDAGYPSDWLAGQRCGVFVGVGPSEYLTRMNKAGVVKHAQAFWGNEASVLAARISYLLNLRGPSVAINTACSSSLVALHLACQSIATGESQLAIAGGVFLALAPDYLIVASNGTMLSPDGRCKTFDDSADGFGPGEGVGVLVLRPLAEALADGDQIYGVIKATAVNQDGRTNGITAPSGLAQTEVELAAYELAGITADTINYVEAHGTGTRLGDPIEVEALTQAFRTYTDRRQFCPIGSIKTNIGHTAAAAGVAGVIKVLLSMRHGKIPASLNFDTPNRHIDFADTPFFVNTELRDWQPPAGQPRRAVVSAFGFSGTNAHAVIEQPPPRPPAAPGRAGPYAVPVSARTPTALRAWLARLADWLAEHATETTLAEVAWNLQVCRDHFDQRVVLVARDLADLQHQARRLAEGTQQADPSGQVAADSDRLVQDYLAGQDVTWTSVWSGERHRRLSLPGYVFDAVRHWYADPDTAYTDAPQPPPVNGLQVNGLQVNGANEQDDDERLRVVLRRLHAGDIDEAEAETAMEAILGD